MTEPKSGPDPRRMRQIHDALESLYPGERSALLDSHRGSPVDVLVATILSQATTDKLSSRAFEALKRSFPVWEDLLSMPAEDLEKLIAVGGLQREKAKKLQAVLGRLLGDFGKISLDAIAEWPLERAYEYLLSLPGVGPKTAACVLGFGFGKPAFPVDTHVLRMAKRLGLVPEKWGAAKAQAALEEAAPPEIRMPLHIMMIRHGREVCSARRPRCRVCPLLPLCLTPGK